MIYRPTSIIPVSSSSFKGNERTYLLDCLSRNWITQGYYVRQFEEKMSEWSGRKHAIACSSGTAALHLSLISLELKENDIAIVPAITYIATANAAKYCKMRVRFSDVDLNSWCITKGLIDKSLLSSPDWGFCDRVVLGVDLYDSRYENGNFCYVADASESLMSDTSSVSTLSFYGNKIITTGEGGMVLTDDDDFAALVRLYRGQGATTQGDYFHSVIGYNYRMTDLQAAVGLAQLEQIDEFIAYRRMIIDRYRDNLKDDERFTLQGGQRSNGWMFALLLPKWIDSSSRHLIREQLRQDMIETRPFFRPIPSLPPYFESDYQDKYPVACELYRRGICLPTHVNLTIQDVDYICETLKEVVTNG